MTSVSTKPPYGWTFLVARGRRRGYRSLLIPELLADSNEGGVLDQLAGGETGVEIAEVHGLTLGDVVLVSQTERLAANDLGARMGDPPTDQFGRPLEVLYGFVIRAGGISELDDTDLASARAEAMRTYRRFLADESGFQPEISKSFALRSTPGLTVSAAPPQLVDTGRSSESVAASSGLSSVSGRNLVLVVVLAIAASAAVWFLLLSGRGGPVTNVEIAELKSSAVDCTQPITVQGTITTDDSATITYHWESTLTTDSTPVSLEFASAATQTVETSIQPDASGTALTFTQTLVVDDPNSAESSHKYTLTCR